MGTSISFERMADRYDDSRGGMQRGRSFAEAVSPHVVEGAPVLEIGVGTGAIALGLVEAGHDVVGVDLSPAMLGHARDRLGARTVVGDATSLPVRAASVSTVLASWLVHLVGDTDALFAEVDRVLQPSGRWIVIDARPRWRDDDILEIQQGVFDLRAFTPASTLLEASDRFEVLSIGATPADTFHQSPNEVADMIESRTWSSLWDLDDDTWQHRIVPVIDGLRDLPEPDRSRERSNAHPLVVARARR